MMDSAGGGGVVRGGKNKKGVATWLRASERSGSDTVLGIGLQALVVLGTHTKQLKGKKIKIRKKQ